MNATKIIASTTGVLTGVSGFNHGFFEAIQGNHATDGFLVNAVGKGYSWTVWRNGGEGAFTVIPNFFVTGILTMIVAVLLAVWSAGFIHTRRGTTVFLLVGLMLFLFGGGVAQVPFIILTWSVATRIDKPLFTWKKLLSENTRIKIAKAWAKLLIVSYSMILLALELAIFGFLPGITDPNTLQLICWSSLVCGTAILLTSIVAGFASDIQTQAKQHQKVPLFNLVKSKLREEIEVQL